MRGKLGTVILGLSILMSNTGEVVWATDQVAADNPWKAAAGALQEALDRAGETDDPAANYRQLVDASRQAIGQLGADAYAAKALASQIADAEKISAEKPAEAARQLRSIMQDVAQRLAFEPLKEADVPEGFPSYTPVGEVEIKQYPAYRMAQADSGVSAFWALFNHIKKHEIAMTAPVQMDYTTRASGQPQEQHMAFLYGSPKIGELGTDGKVQVVDVAPVTAISTGVRGRRTQQQLDDALSRLNRWLESNKDRYRPSGDFRVMGYNSPFVPAERQYFEVQIPIEKMGQ